MSLGRKCGVALRGFLAFTLDPPGWIPAWATTAVLLALAWKSVKEPSALPALQVVADVLKITLTIWLGYKGLRVLPELVETIRTMRSRRKADPPPTAGNP